MIKLSILKQGGRAYRQAGDTIVEVLVAIAIMGLALGSAYALSNRSFRTAMHSKERTEALALAQGQVEFLRDTSLSDTIGSLLARYPSGTEFCFKEDDGSDETVTTGDDYCDSYGPSNNSLYNISVVYCDGSAGCGPANVFTITATWIGAGGGDNNLKLYYKPPI